MTHLKSILAAAGVLALATATAQAQSSQQQAPNPIQSILGAIFGGGGDTTSIDAQWNAGRRPLNTQRIQFHNRVDSDVRSGALTFLHGQRLKADYDALVQLETRYAADGRFTTSERAELSDRYGALTQILADGGYATGGGNAVTLAQGRTEFQRRVETAVQARRITRGEGNRLMNDYAALVQIETRYLRDGVIDARERQDLDARLDVLEARVGDGFGGGQSALTLQARLAAIERALPGSRLRPALQSQIRVEHGDLVRLDAAYARMNPTQEERAYLERRISDLEVRVGLSR